MTKRDYKLIAKALRNSKPDKTIDQHYWEIAVIYLAEALYDDNPKFDCNKFYTACEYLE